MKPNDLRYKNLVEYDGRIFEIESIAEEFPTLNTIEFGIGVVDWNNIKPVKITGELLLIFGFEIYQWTNAYFIKTKFGALMIQFLKDEIHLFFTNVGADSQGMKMYGRKYIENLNSTQKIKHAHQLQNLYFALTGEELTLKN